MAKVQSRYYSAILSRRALARIMSTFLCAVIVVVRPFSRLGGPSAFLVLTFKELVFSVQDDIAHQMEATVLNIMGALIGIGLSTLASFIATYHTHFLGGSVEPRTMPAAFLVAIAFGAGLLKSRLPRLHLSTRICCFVSIFILTTDLGVRSDVAAQATEFLWITLCAAVICLVSSLLMLQWSTANFAEEIANTLFSLRGSISIVLDRAFSEAMGPDAVAYQQSQEALLAKAISLNVAYSQAVFEVRVGRLSVRCIKPFIGIVEHLRRELVWGMSFSGFERHPFSRPNPMQAEESERSTLLTFQVPAAELGQAIVTSLHVVEQSIRIGYLNADLPADFGKETISAAQERISLAQNVAREKLGHILDELDIADQTLHNPAATGIRKPIPQQVFELCLFMISLVQMAHELQRALQLANDLVVRRSKSRIRFWYPRLSLSWLGVAPRMYISDDRIIAINAEFFNPGLGLSTAESREGLLEHGYGVPNHITDNFHLRSWKDPASFIRAFWRSRDILRIRLVLSRVMRSVKHSIHLRYAFKSAAGVAFLSLPAFLPSDSTGRKWFTKVHGQWMIVSYIWVLETNTGATWRVAYLRLFGTLMGAIYAYMTWVICHTHPYGLVILITVAELPVTWLITATSVPSVGIVASVTLPPIVFARYIEDTSSTPVLELAVFRGLMIALGIVGALMMNHFVFPRHCRVLFLSNTSRTISLLTSLYLSLSRSLSRDDVQNNHSFTPHDRHKTLKLELAIRSALHQSSALIVTMSDELSLLPKPVRRYRKVVATLQKLLDLMTGLRKIRENIPRKETVASIFKERCDFMSCICISLFACEHAFRANNPLPQFLPSSRRALDNLESHAEESIRHAREMDPHAMGLSLIYAFAELQAMKDMVQCLEELLESTRQLFGTSAWLSQQSMKWELSVEHVGAAFVA